MQNLTFTSSNQSPASCTVWWEDTPSFANHRVGLIGQFQAADDASSVQLLDDACKVLLENKCTLAVGPMDGSTWNRYRFVSRSDCRPAFFLEPQNPSFFPEHFHKAGFREIAKYHSAYAKNVRVAKSHTSTLAQRMHNEGVRFRTLDLSNYESELKKIYGVCIESFANNFMFTPISEESFLALYKPLKAFVEPKLVLIAEVDGKIVGFNFCLPDHSASDEKTMIVKTLARCNDRKYAGLGKLMLAMSHNNAADLGYGAVIHALFHEQNKSSTLSGELAETFRDYSLYARTL
jgi:L-amino acid N-acyltransferase YncA